MTAQRKDPKQKNASGRRSRRSVRRAFGPRAEDLVDAYLVASFDAVIVMDARGRVVEFNPAAERIFGFTRSRALGAPLADLIIPSHLRAQHSRGLANYLDTGRAKFIGKHSRVDAVRSDGTEFPCELTLLETAQDGHRLFVAHLRDLSVDAAFQEQAERRHRQQTMLAALGRHALTMDSLDELFDYCVSEVVYVLDVEYCKVLELLPGGDALLLRAGVGWQDGAVGVATVPSDKHSQAGYTLITNDPVVVNDVAQEGRFEFPDLLHEHGVISGVSASIDDYGVLGAHSTRVREFSDEDGNFIQSVANVLSASIARERTQALISQSEYFLRTLVTNIPTGVRRVDLDGKIIFSNPAHTRMYGMIEDAIIGMYYWEFEADEKSRQQVAEEFKMLVSNQPAPYPHIARNRRADGSFIDVHVDWAYDRNPQGELVGFISIVSDQTERLRMQKALVESERKYRDLVENTHDLIWVVDNDGVITYINQASKRIYGLTPGEMIGRPYSDFVPDGQMEKNNALLARARETGTIPDEYVNEVRHRDGSPVMLSANSVFLRDDSGNIVGSTGVSRDITRQWRAEQSLAESRARLAALFEQSLDAILFADDEARYLDANPAACRLLGYSRDALVALGVADVTPADSAPLTAPLWSEFIDRGEMSGEYQLVHSDGTPVDVEYRAVANIVPGVHLSVLRDVTEKLRVQQRLERNAETLSILTRQLIEAREKERRRVARELHDVVGQALVAVQLDLNALLSEPKTREPGDIKDGLALVDVALERVRDVSQELRPIMLDEFGLAAALEWYLGRQSRRAGVDIQLDVEDADSRLPPEIEISAYRLVEGVITNALRHAKAKHIRVQLERRNDELSLLVRDDGIGFDVDGVRRSARRGHSLGLIFLEEHATMIGGTLEIESTPGHGTEIRVRLPADTSSPD